MSHYPRTVASVGGVVVRDDALLLVRMTYSPSKGQYMLPGGVVESGETLDGAVTREVREETGVEARPLAIIGVSSIVHAGETHTYATFLMEPLTGDPRADGAEADDCRYLTFAEIEERDDVSYLVKYVARRVRDGNLRQLCHVADFREHVGGLTDETFRLFM